MKNDTPLVVLVTVPDLETGKTIAVSLLQEQLAACVNILPGLFSIYQWEGEIKEDQEVLLLIKTRLALFESQLIPLLKELHPYQVPEIIALPIEEGDRDYLTWIISETGGSAVDS